MSGYFLNFEGVDGSGKSSQLDLLYDHLKALGKDVVLTREPGGTPYAEEIRNLILKKDVVEKVLPMTEVLLFNASRYQHYKTLIEPAIERGAIVLCDRFLPSTIAYQGVKGGISKNEVLDIHYRVFGDVFPHLNIVVDIDPDIAYSRVISRPDPDRIELGLKDKIQSIRQSYLDQALESPDDFIVINGDGTIEQVHQEILELVLDKIGVLENE